MALFRPLIAIAALAFLPAPALGQTAGKAFGACPWQQMEADGRGRYYYALPQNARTANDFLNNRDYARANYWFGLLQTWATGCMQIPSGSPSNDRVIAQFYYLSVYAGLMQGVSRYNIGTEEERSGGWDMVENARKKLWTLSYDSGGGPKQQQDAKKNYGYAVKWLESHPRE